MRVTRVQSAADMYQACVHLFEQVDIAVMAAAVADYTPVTVAPEKIKKKEATLTIELTRSKGHTQNARCGKTKRSACGWFCAGNK